VPNFNLADYETVDSRIKRFYTDNPGGRISTELIAYEGDVGKTRWIVKASVWRSRFADRDMTIPAEQPDGTGYAFEVDGSGMANKTSALENGETSAIGRALANIGYSGDKRASREEMQKTAAPVNDTLNNIASDWVEAIEAATTLSDLQATWEAAGKSGATRDPRVVDAKNARKVALSG